jgi:hypothetical protein
MEATMESIEMIKVRSFSDEEKQKALEIFSDISIEEQNELLKIDLFQEQDIPTDFIVCIHWDENGIKKVSDISEKLIAALKNYGWISYSIWNPLSTINREIC